MYIFPGIGLGTILSKATNVTDGMVEQAAVALAESLTEAEKDAGLVYPRLTRIRDISAQIALAVIRAAQKDVSFVFLSLSSQCSLKISKWTRTRFSEVCQTRLSWSMSRESNGRPHLITLLSLVCKGPTFLLSFLFWVSSTVKTTTVYHIYFSSLLDAHFFSSLITMVSLRIDDIIQREVHTWKLVQFPLKDIKPMIHSLECRETRQSSTTSCARHRVEVKDVLDP